MPPDGAAPGPRREARAAATATMVALGAILLLTTIGAVPTSSRRAAAPPITPAGTRPGRLHLEPCEFRTAHGTYEADCGWLDVPERPHPGAPRIIRLPVTRVRSTAAEPAEPIVNLGGGPGQSNMGFRPRPELLANHDVLLVGYRGVDGSVVLDCPEVVRAMRGVGGDLLGARSSANLGHAFRRCAERLREEGIDLDAYTMLDVVRDLEAARTALGYERVHLLSGSYGTRVAQIYAAQHPERIRRSIMVAVNPPGRFVWEPDITDHLLASIAQLCAEDARCRARTPDLVATFRHVTQHMPPRWLVVPIDPGKVQVVAFALLFGRDTAAQVVDAFVAAERGDASGLALLSLAYDVIFPTMFVWGDLAAKAASADHDPQRDYAAEMVPANAALGAPLSKLLWSAVEWPSNPIPAAFRSVQPSDVETLLISGSIDVSTPAVYATRELLPHLTNGRHVVLRELGHTDLWSVQRPAMARLQSRFFASGAVDDTHFAYAPMDFRVTWGFPTLAKLALAAVALVVPAVVGLVWLAVRRLRARRATRTTP